MESSPTSAKRLTPTPKLINFPEAMAAVILGEKVTRKEWDDQQCYGLISEGRLKLQKPEGIFDWVVSDGDMLATDWFAIQAK